MVAGPLATVYVTAPLEAEVALTLKGALPYVCDGIAAKLSVGGTVPLRTMACSA